MNVLKLSDRQLSDMRQALANESGRRTRIAVSGHDPASMIWGNEAAKRAVTIAAAGKHSILFAGPSNSGKTMLRALCLELRIEEAYEARHCPCGNYSDPRSRCACTLKQIERQVARFPVADITVQTFRPVEREINTHGTTLAAMREVIGRASSHTDETLDEYASSLLKAAIREFALDLVAVSRILHVARTIANLDCSSQVRAQDVAESINYRAIRR